MSDTSPSEEFMQAYQYAMAQMMEAGIKSFRSSDMLRNITKDEVQIAQTPSDVVFQVDKVTVSRYRPLNDNPIDAPPVLIAYGMFGRQTMIDLQEDRSLVRNLLTAGLDVYVLDWGNPTRADQFVTLDDMINGWMRDCIEFLVEKSGGPITMFGICEGGTFATCLAATQPQLFAGLALTITPVDFKGDPENFWRGEGFLNQWLSNFSEDDVNKLVDTHGNMPGALTGAMFSALTPMNSMTKYNLGLQRLDGDADATLNFLRMEKWIADRPDHPGAAAKEWFNKFYRENQLVNGEFTLDGQTVDLKNISCPVMNIYALQDHIVPISCTKPLSNFIKPKDYTEIGFPGGHVGVFVSRKAQGVVAQGFVDWVNKTQIKKQKK
ncbi:class III poly(R)-hydroxyalkanoic acid synthase subunit PhaC [Amylibacter kogurei]|uniref:Class III poly(R)-hydroxyalkanoic acid synthase subunit PhaC n=1 Tax=Paramylibacter kogurei TaxID=1889778 RepID=A0A2G5K352_9RHOB|nr:alpha/beta fold hydrolase [Amylibacter kogurei]PIB23539.1 class III poly(R)-hydroxyalkanoic acid synthase subunit PhaC [Amylibacter kogurei]